MKKILKGYLLGLLSAILFVSGAVYAANTVRIVVDGREIHPTDANGNSVSPIVQNGTTYLPVRAVADALGKAVYWDGPNYTVYIGEMDGELDYPTYELSIDDNIGDYCYEADGDYLTDNYGNSYRSGIQIPNSRYCFETLLNMKYSHFKCTLYVAEGYSGDGTGKFNIKTDGKTVYTSPTLTKTSRPVDIDVDITGCNDFVIEFIGSDASSMNFCIGDAGFYQ